MIKRDKLIKLYVDQQTYDLLVSLSDEFGYSISRYVFMIVRSFLLNSIQLDSDKEVM